MNSPDKQLESPPITLTLKRPFFIKIMRMIKRKNLVIFTIAAAAAGGIFLAAHFIAKAASVESNSGSNFSSEGVGAGTDGEPWYSPQNAQDSDDSYATFTASCELANQNSQYLKAQRFGFNIPDGSTINGIVVEIERREDQESTAVIKDSWVTLVDKHGSIIEDNIENHADTNTAWPASDEYKTYGHPHDLWLLSHSWTADDINNANFGTAIVATLDKCESHNDKESGSIDHIRITVYYTPTTIAGTASVSPAWVKGGTTGQNFTFKVINSASSEAPIRWVRFTRPSSNYTITGGSASGWNILSSNASAISFTDGSIPINASTTFTVTANIASANEARTAWTVDISFTTDGSYSTQATESSSDSLKTGIDSTAPTNVSIVSVTVDSSSQLTALAATGTDSGAGLHSSPYWFDETTGNPGGSDSTDWQASRSWVDTGLNPLTQYCYRVKVRDAVLNESSFSSAVCGTTTSTPDTTPPVISSVSAANLSQTSVRISWTTNEPADSQVEYGLTESYGSATTLDPNLVTSHEVTITGLTAGSTYNYRVKSRDAAGNLATSTNKTFTLPSAGGGVLSQPPVISGLGVLPGVTTTLIAWTTDKPAKAKVRYGKTADYDKEIIGTTYNVSHRFILQNLTPATEYNFKLILEDLDTNFTQTANITFTTLKEPPPPPEITDIKVLAVRPTSIKIIWKTKTPATSQIIFGTASGNLNLSTVENKTLKQDHEITITDLTPGKEYFYVVISRNEGGIAATSKEQRVTTEPLEVQTVVEITKPLALAPGSPETQIPKIAPGETVTAIPILGTEGDKIPPEITLFKFAENPTQNTSPVIRGRVIDRQGVIAGLAYSRDGGKSWHPMTEVKGIGSSAATFSATMIDLKEGDYPIVIKARDNSGNVAKSEPVILTIDILPPTSGANAILLGSQYVFPTAKTGMIGTLTGLTMKIITSASGGAVKVEAIAEKVSAGGTVTTTSSFPLVYSPADNLWSGDLKFDEEGEWNISIKSVDGANRTWVKPINPVSVGKAGKITSLKDGKPIKNAKISVYQYSEENRGFILWPSDVFNQVNPLQTDDKGAYQFILPPGKYYLEVEAPLHKKFYSDIMEFTRHRVINFNITLSPAPKPLVSFTIPILNKSVRVAPPALLDLFGYRRIEKKPEPEASQPELIASLIGQPAPTFALPDKTGTKLDLRNLRGKKTVLSTWTSWSALAQAQTPILAEIQDKNPDDVRILLLTEQEASGIVSTYFQRGKYNLNAVIDNEGVLGKLYPIWSIPQHFFIDRKGILRNIYFGFLDSEDLQKELDKL